MFKQFMTWLKMIEKSSCIDMDFKHGLVLHSMHTGAGAPLFRNDRVPLESFLVDLRMNRRVESLDLEFSGVL